MWVWAFLVGRILKVSVCVCLFCFATYAYYPPFIEFFWVVTFYFTMFCLWYYPSLLTPNIYVQSRWVEDLLEFKSILLFSRSFYKISLSNYSSVNFFFFLLHLYFVLLLLDFLYYFFIFSNPNSLFDFTYIIAMWHGRVLGYLCGFPLFQSLVPYPCSYYVPTISLSYPSTRSTVIWSTILSPNYTMPPACLSC